MRGIKIDDDLEIRVRRLAADEDACRGILLDGHIPQTKAQVLNSGSEGGGLAFISALMKPVELPLEHVVFLLWAREFVHTEGWDQLYRDDLRSVWNYALGGSYMLDEFRAFAQSFASGTDARSLSLVEASHHINIIFGLLFPDITKRAVALSAFYGNMLGGDICFAIQINDAWNRRISLFETTRSFVYMDWGTSA